MKPEIRIEMLRQSRRHLEEKHKGHLLSGFEYQKYHEEHRRLDAEISACLTIRMMALERGHRVIDPPVPSSE